MLHNCRKQDKPARIVNGTESLVRKKCSRLLIIPKLTQLLNISKSQEYKHVLYTNQNILNVSQVTD